MVKSYQVLSWSSADSLFRWWRGLLQLRREVIYLFKFSWVQMCCIQILWGVCSGLPAIILHWSYNCINSSISELIHGIPNLQAWPFYGSKRDERFVQLGLLKARARWILIMILQVKVHLLGSNWSYRERERETKDQENRVQNKCREYDVREVVRVYWYRWVYAYFMFFLLGL